MSAPSPLAEILSNRSQRWLLLRDVIAQWYAPLETRDGVSPGQLRVSLPTALREWYALAGARKDVWSRQDHYLHPSEVREEGEFLVFMVENQGVVKWGTPSATTAEDSPVYVSSLDDPTAWLKESDTVSEFALQMFAYCLKWNDQCRWWTNAYVGPRVLEVVASTYPRLPFPSGTGLRRLASTGFETSWPRWRRSQAKMALGCT